MSVRVGIIGIGNIGSAHAGDDLFRVVIGLVKAE